MQEIDIWRSAALLVKQYGADADLQAARHMDAMIERGDPAGEAAWKRVRAAIAELRRNTPSAADQIH